MTHTNQHSEPLTAETLRGLLSREEFAEHQRLTRLLELARSHSPLTTTQLAELMHCSPDAISAIEYRAKHKILKALTSPN